MDYQQRLTRWQALPLKKRVRDTPPQPDDKIDPPSAWTTYDVAFGQWVAERDAFDVAEEERRFKRRQRNKPWWVYAMFMIVALYSWAFDVPEQRQMIGLEMVFGIVIVSLVIDIHNMVERIEREARKKGGGQ